ncbi:MULTISPECIES: sensor domain-containing protein [unclassified Rhodococcus (in: high G+C Gram-positive bacteria)]|uniref:sensor domain-containing protein n=1 Tax=unclassified Rhodococcus (in: high G+C Gram-positive bacteria) TaxID=192944 RepID=UPI0037CAB168
MRSRRTAVLRAIAVPVVTLSAAAALLSGCSSTVSGVAQPSPAIAVGSPSGKGLSKLLVDPADFPARYEAIVLPAQAVAMAAPDLTGVSQGAVVDPADCAPPAQDYGPTGTVMAVGTDNASRSTISIELTKTDTPLDELAAQTERCGEVTVTDNGAESTVTTEVTPAPPVRADDTLALRRTVKSGNDSEKVTQSMITLIAQVGDVRVSATFMSFGDAKADTVALDEVFTAAVQKVQNS